MVSPSGDFYEWHKSEKKRRAREEYLESLAQRHAERWNIPLHIARRHIAKISITSLGRVRYDYVNLLRGGLD